MCLHCRHTDGTPLGLSKQFCCDSATPLDVDEPRNMRSQARRTRERTTPYRHMALRYRRCRCSRLTFELMAVWTHLSKSLLTRRSNHWSDLFRSEVDVEMSLLPSFHFLVDFRSPWLCLLCGSVSVSVVLSLVLSLV